MGRHFENAYMHSLVLTALPWFDAVDNGGSKLTQEMRGISRMELEKY